MYLTYFYIFLFAIIVNLTVGTGFYFTMSDNDISNLPKESFSRWVACVYFSIITFATIGYGDIVPISNFARITVAIYITVISLTLFPIVVEVITRRINMKNLPLN